MEFKSSDRYTKAIELIDYKNSNDPNTESDNGIILPKELLYSHRMTELLEEYYPEAGELLHIAARGQHIQRWTIERTEYPDGKAGYHAWRKELSLMHSRILGEILSSCEYSDSDIKFIESLLNKQELKSNNDSQILQDVVSIVFLKYYALDFAKKHKDKNIEDILKKVFRKMSEKAIAKAIEVSPIQITEAINQIQ